MNKISAYMITFNNEKTVENALKSLSWADEIVVVDSFSTDKTVEIAQKYATILKQQSFLGFQKQYQFAANLCSNEWRFFLDADEVVPENLATEICQAVRNKENFFGFICKRRSFYIDRWIKWGAWKSDREMRLYNKKFGDWTSTGLHSCVSVEGKSQILKNFILHYPYENISYQLKTVDKYTSIAARDMFESGKKMSFTKFLLNPPWRFFKEYFLKLGILDGVPGLVIAFNSASHVFHKQAKLHEILCSKKEENKH